MYVFQVFVIQMIILFGEAFVIFPERLVILVRIPAILGSGSS
jgi:hypothetical protein